MITQRRMKLNTESALKALEAAKTSALAAQKAASTALESIAKFWDVVGDDSWNDIRSAWQTQQDIEDGDTLFRKLSLITEMDDQKNIVVVLSSPIDGISKPKWTVELNAKECATLAHCLLRESGVTK
jgi:hypothetical protein